MNKIVKLSLSVFLALGLVSVNANSHAFVGVGVAQQVKNSVDKHNLTGSDAPKYKNAQGIKASLGYGLDLAGTDFGVDVSFDYQYNLESKFTDANDIENKISNHLIYITPGVNYNIMGGTYGKVFVKMGFGYNIQNLKQSASFPFDEAKLKNDFAVKVSTGYEYTIAEMHAIAVDYTYAVSYFRYGLLKNSTIQSQSNIHEIGLGYKFKLAI